MRDDQIGAVLRESNPWWLVPVMKTPSTGWTASHRMLRDRDRYDLGYRSPVLEDVAHDPVDDKLVILTGLSPGSGGLGGPVGGAAHDLFSRWRTVEYRRPARPLQRC